MSETAWWRTGPNSLQIVHGKIPENPLKRRARLQKLHATQDDVMLEYGCLVTHLVNDVTSRNYLQHPSNESLPPLAFSLEQQKDSITGLFQVSGNLHQKLSVYWEKVGTLSVAVTMKVDGVSVEAL